MHKDQEDPQYDMACTESGACVDVAFLYNLTLKGFQQGMNGFELVHLSKQNPLLEPQWWSWRSVHNKFPA